MLLYSMLYLCGYGLTLDDLKNFRQLGSPTAGHPEYGHADGIEATTGPLGQGIAMCVGLALAERMLAARFNRDGHEIIDHHTFTIASDGDLQEGISGEASSLAGHLGLGRLIAFYDDNHISIEGDTALSFSEDVGARYEAYGWHVQNLGEDIELDRIEATRRRAGGNGPRPSLIIVRTHIAPGSPNKQDTAAAHGAPLGEDEVRLTKEAYGWPPDEHFLVPDEALEVYRATNETGAAAEGEWKERFEAYRSAHPDLAAELERMTRELPVGWDSEVPRFHVEDGMIATRKSSQTVLQWAAAQVPELVGGSADLAPSNLTLIDDGGDVEAGEYGGRNLHFGIREHAMGAIVNGLVLHGLRAYGATFLIFSDYMKASIRLAAMMRIPSIFVFTHDSIGLGEDGPTHQPIEQLATLRATPQPQRGAAGRRERDRARLALRARADRDADVLRALAPGSADVEPGRRPGRRDRARRLRAARAVKDPDVILMGTGSEVSIADDARKLLEEDGLRVRLVSMPCLDRFAEQDAAYRDSVLPPACARVSRSRRRAHWAGTAGSATSATWWRWRASARRRRRRCSTSTSASRTGGAAAARCRVPSRRAAHCDAEDPR